MSLNKLAEKIHATAVAKGWWNNNHHRNIPEALALVHSEVSEALEEYRNAREGDDLDAIYYTGDADAKPKPEGFAIELADIIIRVLDLAQGLGIDLDLALKEKMEYNETRPTRHGGKRA